MDVFGDCVVISKYSVEIVDNNGRFLRLVNVFVRYRDVIRFLKKNELLNDTEKYRIIRTDYISDNYEMEESFDSECIYGEWYDGNSDYNANLVQAKCSNCGAIVEVEKNKENAICPMCCAEINVETSISLLSSSKKRLMDDFVIENGILKKYRGAFVDVVIPDSVTEIASDAFDEFRPYLNSIVLPKGLKKIHRNAFEGCHSLYKVVFNDRLESIGENAFFGCNYIKNIELPESLKRIGSYAFGSCYALKSINIPKMTKYIDDFAFSFCKSLVNISFSEGLEVIGYGAFIQCFNLRNLILPNSVVEIKNKAFDSCASLECVKLPERTCVLEGEPFKGCTALRSFTFPENCTNIKESMFLGCSSLIEVKLPAKLKEIGDSAFANCKSLSKIVLPNNLETIKEKAFENCSSLVELNLPNNLKRIEKFAFSGCTSLVDVHIPNNTKMNYYAFAETPKLRLFLPYSVDNLTRLAITAEKSNIVLCDTAYEQFCTNQKYEVPDKEMYINPVKGQSFLDPNGNYTIKKRSVKANGRESDYYSYDIFNMDHLFDEKGTPHSLLSPEMLNSPTMMNVINMNNTVSLVFVRYFKKKGKYVFDFMPYIAFAQKCIGYGTNGQFANLSNYKGFSTDLTKDQAQLQTLFSHTGIRDYKIDIIEAPVVGRDNGKIFNSSKLVQIASQYFVRVQFPLSNLQ